MVSKINNYLKNTIKPVLLAILLTSCQQTTGLEQKLTGSSNKPREIIRLNPMDKPSKQDIKDYINLYGKPPYKEAVYFRRHRVIEELGTVNAFKFIIGDFRRFLHKK